MSDRIPTDKHYHALPLESSAVCAGLGGWVPADVCWLRGACCPKLPGLPGFVPQLIFVLLLRLPGCFRWLQHDSCSVARFSVGSTFPAVVLEAPQPPSGLPHCACFPPWGLLRVPLLCLHGLPWHRGPPCLGYWGKPISPWSSWPGSAGSAIPTSNPPRHWFPQKERHKTEKGHGEF